MSGSNDEGERLRRLKDQQIALRDPGKKGRKVQQVVTRKYKARKKTSVFSLFGDLSHKVRGFMFGMVVGMLIWIGLAMFVDAKWVDGAGIGAIVLLSVLGIVFGTAFDTRDKLRDF